MSETLKRILLAACLSITGIIGTLVWHHWADEKSNLDAGGTPVAQLLTTIRDVERKPLQRLIWEPVQEGSQLYAGETIRTARDSEAHVEFLKSKTRIDLDPDSEIVIQEVDGKIELNFLKGNMFVAGGSGDGELTLKSGNKNISLNGSELNLAQNGKGELDVTVIKGDASLGTLAQIKVVSPRPNESVYVVPKERSPTSFEFAPVPEGYRLTLEIGKSRDDMKPMELTSNSNGKVEAPLKIGRLYWRLVAKSRDSAKPELVSPVFKINVLARTPIVALSPDRGETLALNDFADGVPFHWSNPARLERIQLQILKDGQSVLTQAVEGDSFATKLLQPGEYTWRVDAHLPGREDLVSGEPRPFTVVAKRLLPQPVLVAPRMNDAIPFQTFAARGLDLKWKSVAGATGYKVSLKATKDGEGTVKEAASPVLKLRDLKPGEYQWSVTAVNTRGEESSASNSQLFSLAEVDELRWADGKTDLSQTYLSATPKISLEWDHGPASAVKWRWRVASDHDGSGAANDLEWTTLSKTANTVSVPADGTYFAEVEALDIQGRMLARTLKRRVVLTAEPLLPAPRFDVSLGSEVHATGSGSARFNWSPVAGATEYLLSYEGRGKRSEIRVKDTAAAFSKLMPGRYQVNVRSIDTNGRRGPASEPKTMTVPDKSDVRAPKLKKFNFE